MEDKFVITLHLYDEEIQVKIPREEEEACRKAAINITDTISTLRNMEGKSLCTQLA